MIVLKFLPLDELVSVFTKSISKIKSKFPSEYGTYGLYLVESLFSNEVLRAWILLSAFLLVFWYCEIWPYSPIKLDLQFFWAFKIVSNLSNSSYRPVPEGFKPYCGVCSQQWTHSAYCFSLFPYCWSIMPQIHNLKEDNIILAKIWDISVHICQS